jgi:hypothetical protein
MGDPECCFENCDKDADYELYYGYSPDDYTYSCVEHLGLMVPDKETTVIPLERD